MAALALIACKDEDAKATGPAREEAAPVALAQASGPATAAEVALALEGFSHSVVDGRHRYTHTRRFTEQAGTATTITRGRICVQSGTECVDALVNYPIAARGEFVQAGAHFATPLVVDTITLEYWLTDAGGAEQKILMTIAVDNGQERVVTP
jgi:hypothetical protein